MPRPMMVLAGTFCRSVPSSKMEPEAAGSRPEMAWRVVVLPAPLAPIRDTSSPSATVREMPFRAWMAP